MNNTVSVYEPTGNFNKLIVTFFDGRKSTFFEHESVELVRESQDRVARNPKVIRSITIEHTAGQIETLWTAQT